MTQKAPSLDDFTPTAGTRRGLTLARAVAEERVGAPRVLLLAGPAGIGKTHLLRAAVGEGSGGRPKRARVYVTARDAGEALVAALERGEAGTDSLGWKGADLIVLDDLHGLAALPMTQAEIARQLQAAVAAGSRVLAAACGSLCGLEPFVARLRQVSGFALVILEPPTSRELQRILTRMIRREGESLDERVMTTLAASAVGDVRRAVGALNGYCFTRELQAQSGTPVNSRS